MHIVLRRESRIVVVFINPYVKALILHYTNAHVKVHIP